MSGAPKGCRKACKVAGLPKAVEVVEGCRRLPKGGDGGGVRGVGGVAIGGVGTVGGGWRWWRWWW